MLNVLAAFSPLAATLLEPRILSIRSMPVA